MPASSRETSSLILSLREDADHIALIGSTRMDQVVFLRLTAAALDEEGNVPPGSFGHVDPEVTIAALNKLAAQPPPKLRELDLSFLELCADAVPSLETLLNAISPRALNLRGNDLSSADLLRLFRGDESSRASGGLESLDILGNDGLDGDGLRELGASPGLGRLNSLTLGFNLPLASLRDAHFLPRLKSLCAPGCDANGLNEILRKCNELENLDIHQCSNTDFAAIARAKARSSLRELILFWCSGTAFGDWSGEWPELRTLNLRGVPPGDGLRGASFPRLRFLNVMECKLGGTGIRTLAAEQWPRLESFQAGMVLGESTPASRRNRITGPALEKLLPRMPALRELDLSGSPIGDRGAGALADTDLRPRTLNLSYCRLSSDALSALVDSGILESVENLDLSGQPLGNSGIAALGRCDLSELRQLTLNNTDLRGSEGLEGFLRGSFPKLETLSLTHNEIAAGARLFSGPKLLPNLQLLLLHWNSIPGKDLAAVRRAHPDWTIYDAGALP